MLSHLVPVALGGGAEPTPDEIAAWLDTLPAHDATASSRLLIEKLVVLNRTPGTPRSRLRILDMLRARAERLRPRLEGELRGAMLPLAPPVRETAHVLEKLLKELAAGYVAAVLDTPRPWLALGLRRQVQGPIVAAMALVVARLALCDRLHARAPASAWQDLHRLYRHARELGAHQRNAEASGASPEALYVRALLLAFAEPSRLMPGEHERLQQYVIDFGHLASIVEPPIRGDGRCAFLVDLRRDKPGAAFARRVETPPAGDRLALLTRPLVEQAYVHMARLRSGVSPETLGLPADAVAAGYPALLAKAGRSWRGERRRRSPRFTFRPRVHLSVGFDAAWRSLAGCAGEGADEGEWTIQNESADGFALRFARGAHRSLVVGQLVLVRSRERDATYLCVVRRVQSDGPEHLEIGVQQVVSAAEAARWQPEFAGEGATAVFFCAEARGAPARVVAPAGRARANSLLVVERRDRTMSLRARRFAERGSVADVIEVEPA
jgi:hypothetical protein